MPITELALLQLKSGKHWSDILPHIRIAEVEQAKWSGYPLHFFDVDYLAKSCSCQAGKDVTSLLHLSIAPSSVWGGVRVMVYETVEDSPGASRLAKIISSDDIDWEGEGHDVEGKLEGSFRLVALKSVKALEALDNLKDDKARITSLVRHEISYSRIIEISSQYIEQ